MNQRILLFYMLISVVYCGYAMQDAKDNNEIKQGLYYLTQNLAYMAPEVFEAEVAPEWHRRISFLKRYMEKSFSVADVYNDVIYFNECTHSEATYKMTYAQISFLLTAGPEIQKKVEMPATTEIDRKTALKREYLQLLKYVETFNACHAEYKALWEQAEWRRIRAVLQLK